MGDGFQGIFLLLVLFFWVLEAIASARRKRQGGEIPGELPGEVREQPAGTGEGAGLPSGAAEYPDREVWRDGHDPREGYRALPQRPTGRPMSWEERHGEAAPSTVSGESSGKAEGMIPKGLWEELAALARGERPVPAEPLPVPGGGMEEAREGRRDTGKRREEASVRPGEVLQNPPPGPVPAKPPREIVASDAAMAARTRYTPAVRLSPEDAPTGKRVTLEGGSRKGGIMQSLAGGVTSRELRRAVILHEILGPPVALRGIEWESQEGEGVRRPGLG